MSARFGFLLLLLAAISLAVTGCGRRGALDTPSQAAAEARGEEPSEEEPEEEDKPFILDGLIQ
ncbi:MAG: lipoprotein [Rhizobiaceae bacterium]